MEVSVVGRSQGKIGKSDSAFRELGFCHSKQIFRKNKICFDLTRRWRNSGIRVTLKATNSDVPRSERIARETAMARTLKSDGVRLFVGLPLDAVSDCNTLNHERAITAGLRALKLLGVEGVEFPIWWGIAEKEAMGQYEWSGYLALAEMVRDAGLKLRVSLCFHASEQPKIPLPPWVSRIGEAQPSIFFADRSGRQYKDCLSLAVDDLPVLDGKTAMQVYQQFLESFSSSFSAFMGSTIMDVSVSLGPDGELRYPSYPSMRSNQTPGVGEFQCYDEHMLSQLKQHAQTTGNPNWGISGPHDVPSYDDSPDSGSFFRENGGSWETPYGNFFLSWYTNQLTSHGNRLLSLASSIFNDSPVTVSGKVPLVHSWYKTRSHPSELTAGFYNTVMRDGYDAIAEIFARNSCRMVLPGIDLSDEHQPHGSLSSPELLLSQFKTACRKHGVQISGENSSVSGAPGSFDQIKKNLSRENVDMDSFTYQRMGAYFFSPEHFPSFSEFVRSLNQPKLDLDDQPVCEEEEAFISLPTITETAKNLEMQAA